MKNMNKRKLLLLAAVAALLLAGVGGTVAYIVAHTDPVVNTFEATHVAVDVHADGTIENTGNIDAYIRAAVVATWQDDSGTVHATAPDYTVTHDGWTLNDGFYYYSSAVAPEASTTALHASTTAEAPAEGYTVKVEILAQAIQAEPTNVVTEEWGYTPPATNN